MPTPERIEKVKRVLSFRQPDLRVVLDTVTIAHNASAVIRTCEAAGILHVDIISPNAENPLVNKAISTRAEKWVEVNFYPQPSSCLLSLKKKGYKIAAAHLGGDSLLFTEIDYAQPLALVFGSESEGVSEETLALADFRIRIPMFGMVQSLNLSVSVGIILYEAIRQRKAKGYDEKRRLPDKEFESYLKKWLKLDEDDPSGR